MGASGGVVSSGAGLNGVRWNILDQIYVPKHLSETSFMWHATFPDKSFVPLHVHPTQDEFIHVFEGALDLVLDGAAWKAGPGDHVFLPLGRPHSIHNNSGVSVKCLFGVSPTRMLFDYFGKIDNVRDIDVLTRLAAEHEVPFIGKGA